MKQKIWKWLITAAMLVLIAALLLVTDTVAWRRGSLLDIYVKGAVKLESCLLYEGQTVYRSEASEALTIVEEQFLGLDWHPCKDFAQTTPYDLFIKTTDDGITISIDCLDDTTIRIHVDDLPAWRKAFGTYCVEQPYDIAAIKEALGDPIS